MPVPPLPPVSLVPGCRSTAVQTASGYDVAWKNAGTSQYTVWTTDSNGNYTEI